MAEITLSTERLVLRRPAPQDWPAYHAFMMSERAEFFGAKGDLAKAFRSFAAELGHWEIKGYGMWAVTIKGSDEAIGLIGPWNPPDWPETEIGWMILSEAAGGQGYALEAASAAVADAYSRLGWETIVSYIDPENIRSIRLAERLGAKLDLSAPQPYPDKSCLVYRHPLVGGEAEHG